MSVAQILSANGLVSEKYLPLQVSTESVTLFDNFAVNAQVNTTWTPPKAGFYLFQLNIVMDPAGNAGSAGFSVLNFAADQTANKTIAPAAIDLSVGNSNSWNTCAYMAEGSNVIQFKPATDFTSGGTGYVALRVLGSLPPIM